MKATQQVQQATVALKATKAPQKSEALDQLSGTQCEQLPYSKEKTKQNKDGTIGGHCRDYRDMTAHLKLGSLSKYSPPTGSWLQEVRHAV